MGKPRKDWLKKAALVLTGLSIGAILAEVGLRTYGYEGDYERRHFVFTGPFPLLRKESWIFQQKNRPADGLRVRNGFVPYARDPGEKRVLFLGDSGTYGWGVPDAMNFPALLAQQAPAATRIVNAGVNGFNTCDALTLYRRDLGRLQADVVVLGLFMANDINTNLLCSERMLAYPGWVDRLRARAYERSALFHFFYINALRWSAHMRFGPWRWNGRMIVPSRLHLVEPNGLHMLHYREGELATYLRPPGPLTEHAFELLESLLGELREAAAGDGARLVILLIPAPPAIYGRYLAPAQPKVLAELAARGIRLRPEDLDLQAPTRRVRASCDRLGLACVDPTDDLGRAARNGVRVLRPADDHLSVAGHGILAEALRRSGTLKGLVRESPRPP